MIIEKGKVLNMSEVIEYSDGGILSKELLHNQAGSVTLFSFDAGQALSEHSAPFDALIQVIDGEMELMVEDAPSLLKAGDCFIIPTGARHSLKATSRFKMIITMIRG